MTMKDKLTRTNHKKAYYFAKKIAIYTGSVVGAFVLLAIPVSIVRSVLSETPISETSEKTSSVQNHEVDELLKF